jgi:hypothetical protein
MHKFAENLLRKYAAEGFCPSQRQQRSISRQTEADYDTESHNWVLQFAKIAQTSWLLAGGGGGSGATDIVQGLDSGTDAGK